MLTYDFGRTADGSAVTAYRLENSRGASATILNYGCTVQSLCIPDKAGHLVDVVLGYETVREYEGNDGFVGAVCGRVANRIGNGEFTLNGRTYALARNDGPNHLHGGLKGFDKHVWRGEEKDDKLVLTRLSPDGEEGYPGSLSVTVTYTLTDDNALTISYDADTDADTIVNLTNHSYFNLDGAGSVLHHELQIFAEAITEADSACLTTGRFLPVAGTPFDFRLPKEIGRDISAPYDMQLQYGSGYDHNFVLSATAARETTQASPLLKTAAVLSAPTSGIRMTVLTTQPGIQLYSGNHLTARRGKNGTIGVRDGVCLETQVFPNAIAFPHFPSPVLAAGAHYSAETVYRFETA